MRRGCTDLAWRRTPTAFLALLTIAYAGRCQKPEEAKTIRLVMTSGHSASVTSARFSGDGSLLVTGGSDDAVKVWDTTKHRQLLSFSVNSPLSQSVAISSDGNVLASIDLNQTAYSIAGHDVGVRYPSHIRCISLKTGEELTCFSPKSVDTNALALDAHGTKIASVSTLHAKGELSIEVHEVATGRLLFEAAGETHVREPEGIVFSQDSGRLAVFGGSGKGAFNYVVEIWDLNSKKAIAVGGLAEISAVAFTATGNQILYSTYLGAVGAIELSSGADIKPLHLFGTECLTLDQQKALGVNSFRNRQKIWDKPAVPPHCGHELAIQDESYNLDSIFDIQLSEDGKSVYALARDGSVSAWRLATKTLESKSQRSLATLDDLRSTKTLALAQNGRLAVRTSVDGEVTQWIPNQKPYSFPKQDARWPSILGNGKVIVLRSNSGTFKVFSDANDYKEQLLRLPPGYRNLDLTLSEDSRYLISKDYLYFDSSAQIKLEDAKKSRPKARGEDLIYPNSYEGVDTSAVTVWDLLTSERKRRLPQDQVIVASLPTKDIYLTEHEGTFQHDELTLTSAASETPIKDTEGFLQVGLDPDAINASYVTLDRRRIKVLTFASRETRIVQLPAVAKTVVFSARRRWALAIGSDGTLTLVDLKQCLARPMPLGSPDAMAKFDSAEASLWVFSHQLQTRIDLSSLHHYAVSTGDREYKTLDISDDGHYVFVDGETRDGHIFSRVDASSLAVKNLELRKGDRINGVTADNKRVLVLPGWTPEGKPSYASHIGPQKIEFYDFDAQHFTPGFELPSVKSILLAATNNRILVTDESSNVSLYDSNTGAYTAALGHDIVNFVFSSDEQLLSSASDGRFLIYSLESGKLKASMESSSPEDWLIATPEGLFDGTPQAMADVSFRFSGLITDVAPVDLAYRDYLRQDLLSSIMNGVVPTPTTSLGSLDRNQPTVSLSLIDKSVSAGRKVTIEAKVNSAGQNGHNSQVRDFRLFRNATLIAERDGVLPQQNDSWTNLFEVSLVPGSNQLTAYAFSGTGIKSEDRSLPILEGRGPQHPPRRITIEIGINHYQLAPFQLDYAVADAQAVESALKLPGTQSATISLQLTDQCATKAHILEALMDLSATSTRPPIECGGTRQQLPVVEPEDEVFIFFSGHGLAQSGRFYMLPQDVSTDDVAGIVSQSVSDLEITGALRRVDARYIFLIVDACDSGQILGNPNMPVGPIDGAQGLRQLAFDKGAYVLTASQPFVSAKEVPALKHGLLTYAFAVDGISGGFADLNHDGHITALELMEYARNRVLSLQGRYLPSDQIRRKTPINFHTTTGQRPSVLQIPNSFYRAGSGADFLVSDRSKDATFQFEQLILTPGESMQSRFARLEMEASGKRVTSKRPSVEGQFDDMGRWYLEGVRSIEAAYSDALRRIDTRPFESLPVSSNSIPSLGTFVQAEASLQRLQKAEQARLNDECSHIHELNERILQTKWSAAMKQEALEEYERHTVLKFSPSRREWTHAQLDALNFLRNHAACDSDEIHCTNALSLDKDPMLVDLIKRGTSDLLLDRDIWLNLPSELLEDARDYQDRCAYASP